MRNIYLSQKVGKENWSKNSLLSTLVSAMDKYNTLTFLNIYHNIKPKLKQHKHNTQIQQNILTKQKQIHVEQQRLI